MLVVFVDLTTVNKALCKKKLPELIKTTPSQVSIELLEVYF